MGLNMNHLEEYFRIAMNKNMKYIGVKIEMYGFPKAEIIINENANFQSKLEYYKKSYNDDLTLKTFNGIKIVGITYGNTFEEIEEGLLN